MNIYRIKNTIINLDEVIYVQRDVSGYGVTHHIIVGFRNMNTVTINFISDDEAALCFSDFEKNLRGNNYDTI